MAVLTAGADADQGQVGFFHDRGSGLRAIIALHDVSLGPALGGCLIRPGATKESALPELTELARRGSYQAVMAGVAGGGAQALLLSPPAATDTGEFWRAFGRAINSFGGRYCLVPHPDLGAAQLAEVAKVSRHVLGLATGAGASEVTALGVWLGLEAAVRHRLGQASLRGLRVAIQGLGPVGFALATRLHLVGAELLVADPEPRLVGRAVQELGATGQSYDQILGAEAAVLVPCGPAGLLDEPTVARLRCAVVAGSADRPLATARTGRALQGRGILYAPDYVINAGGLILLAEELRPGGASRERAMVKVCAIPETLTEIFVRAARTSRPTSEMADLIAAERLAAARRRLRPVAPAVMAASA